MNNVDCGVKKVGSPARLVMLFLLFILTLLPLGVATAATESEPNDKVGLANSVAISIPVQGTFSVPGDWDWYKVTVTTPGRLNLSVTTVPANIRAGIALYGRHADFLGLYTYAVNDGDDVFLQYDIVEPGTYFIQLYDADNHVSGLPYTFTAGFAPVVDPQSPNNELGYAFPVSTATITGTIFPAGQNDFFKVNLNAGDALSVYIQSPSAMRTMVSLLDPDFRWTGIYSYAVNDGDDVYLNWTATSTGTYYLTINDQMGRSHTQPYSIQVSGFTGSPPVRTPVVTESEPNDSYSRANFAALGTAVSGSVSQVGDVDTYLVDIPQTGQFTFGIAQSPSNYKVRVNLYNSSGNRLLSGQATQDGGLFQLTYDVMNPGLYYITVDSSDYGLFSAEVYSLTTAFVPVNDIYELNNNYGDAILLNIESKIDAFIFPTGDQDWYKVTVVEPGELKVVVHNPPPNITPQITIYNMSREYVAGISGIMAGMDVELIHPVTITGTYLIQINDRDNNNEATTPYTLSVNGALFIRYAPLARIDLISPSAIVSGESILFSGSGTDVDGTVTGYSWRSDIDGVFGNTAVLTTTALSVGTHMIYLKVQDNDGLWSPEVRQLVYVGSRVSDEVEPNSPIGNANEIGLGSPGNEKPARGKINESGDQDFYKVYVDRPGRFKITASNVPINLRLGLYLYDRNMGWLGVYNYALEDGTNVALEYDVTETGFYYVQVSDAAGNFDADNTYTLSATLEPAPDAVESNNAMVNAYTMETNSVRGYLFPHGDADWYKIWVDAGNTVRVDVTDVPGNLRPCLYYYDRNRNWTGVWSCASNAGDPIFISNLFNEAGYVYIQVNDVGYEENWTATYQLTVTGANPGYTPSELPLSLEQESNNVIGDANPVGFGIPITGTIGAQGDMDWFAFRVSMAGVLRTELTNVASNLQPRIRIVQDDGGQIDSRTATNLGDNISLETRITRPGKYYVALDNSDWSQFSTQSYRLALSFSPVQDVYEPNNTIGYATVLRGHNTIEALIFDRGDVDWYNVHGNAGDTLKITVANVPPEIKPVIEIYNNSGQWLVQKVATNLGQELTLSFEMPTAGEYFFRIYDANNNFSVQPYTLIVNGAQFSSYAPVAIIDSVAPNPAITGQAVLIEGHGEDTGGSIVGYAWRSSIDGLLSESRVFSLDNLSTGRHTLYFKVKDNDQNWSPETSTLLYVGVSAPAEIEPNDKLGDATPIEFGIQYAGTIDPVGDYDYYTIQVTEPGRLSVLVTNPLGSSMKAQIGFYDRDAQWTGYYVNANSNGDPVTLERDITEPGYYTVYVCDNNYGAGNTYGITADFKPVRDPFEPNQDGAHAAALSPRGTIEAYMFPAGDYDWYKVTVDKPGYLTLTITNTSSILRPGINLYGPNLNWLGIYKIANYDGDNVTLTYEIASPGTYYMHVYDNDNHTDPDHPYKFTTLFTEVPDQNEPNNDQWHAKLVNQSPLNGYIFPTGEHDWYKLYARTGVVTITADNLPSNLRLELVLYNADYAYLSVYGSSSADGEPVTITYTIPETGFYYLSLRETTGKSSPLPYRLTIAGAELTNIPGEQPANSESEPNNEFRRATPISNQPVSGVIGGGSDADWYKFDVQEPGLLALSVAMTSTMRSAIILYDANYQQRAYREAENNGDASTLFFPITETGTWYVRISDANGSGAVMPYVLTMSQQLNTDAFEPNPDFASARSIPLGQSLQATIFPNGDRDWFKVQIDRPGFIGVELTQVPPNIRIGARIISSNTSQLAIRESLNGGESIEFTYVAPSTGTYYIETYDRTGVVYSLTPYTLTTFFTPYEDAGEPNNNFGSATAIGPANRATGLIYPAGDEDWFRFEVSVAGTVRIQVAQTDGIEPEVTLFNSSKEQLAWVARRNKGDSALLTHTVTSADTYYIRIRDVNGDNYSTRAYMLTVEGGTFTNCFPIATIESITPNPSITGSQVFAVGHGTDCNGTVVGYEWTSDLNGSLGYGPFPSWNTLSKGTHRIGLRVQDNEGNWSAPVYKKAYVADEILEEAEYNNAVGEADPLPLNTWMKGRIYPQWDTDFYWFYLGERGFLTVTIDGIPPQMRPYIDFYDGNGGYTGSDWVGNAGEPLIHSRFMAAGWYYLRVSDNAGGVYTDTYGLNISFTPVQDAYEPNDTIGTATVIGPNATVNDAEICREGDYDWYRVEITQPGRLRLGLTNIPSGMTGQIVLYDPAMNFMGLYNTANYPGEDVFLTYDATVPGTYYAQVLDTSNRGYTEPYTFTSSFTPVTDVFENNNVAGRAYYVSSGSTAGPVDAYMFPGGDIDWFKIYAAAGSTISVAVTQPPAGMRTQMEIYNKHLQWTGAYQPANNNDDWVYLSYTAPYDGYYYIRIVDTNSASYVTPYKLSISGGTTGPTVTPQTTEVAPNQDFGDATYIPVDTGVITVTVNGTINPADQTDWFRFYVNSSGILEIGHTDFRRNGSGGTYTVEECVSNGLCVMSEMWVYDGSKNQIAYRTVTNPGEDNVLVMTVMEPGWYYVALADRDRNTPSIEPYTLRVIHTPVVDPLEPNDHVGTATRLGQNLIQGYIFDNNDEDWFRLYMAQSGVITVSVEQIPTNIRPHIELFNRDKGWVAGWVATNPGQTEANALVYQVNDPGFYYLRFWHESKNAYSNQLYQLRIEGVDFTTAPRLYPIGNREIPETIPYAFTVFGWDPNDQPLTFSATGLPPGGTFDPATRTFSWTPGYGTSGSYPGIRFEVSDGTYSDYEVISITVNPTDRAPVLSTIGNLTITTTMELRFQLQATDPDSGAQLTYSAENLPTGATFDANTGTFSWTPTHQQAGNYTGLLFKVTDGVRTDYEYININVILKYRMTVIKDGTGTGTVTSTPAGINCGSACVGMFDGNTSVALSPVAGPGSVFGGWGGACSGTQGCDVTMSGDKILFAVFDRVAEPVTQSQFTTTEDFEKGLLTGVSARTVLDQLQLGQEGTAFPFVWVPNQNGTVSKVDARTGNELGRYKTGPDGVNLQPSRTTVDLSGNVWVGNRQAGTVVKIGLLENNQCIDRNVNGTIETSRDVDGDGDISAGEMLPWGQDECVLIEVVLITGSEGTYVPGSYPGAYADNWGNPGPRSIAVDAGNNVWVGCHDPQKFYYVNGSSGAIMKTLDLSAYAHTPYGAVMDTRGAVWSSGHPTSHIVKIDPSVEPPAVTDIDTGHVVYGLGLDHLGYVYVSGWDSSALTRINTATNATDWTITLSELYQGRGIAVTSDNNVWVASSGTGRVARLNSSGDLITTIDVGSQPTGVATGVGDKVWVVNLGDENIHRIDPVTNSVDITKQLVGSGGHYGYSDMTGSIVRTIATRTGTWSVVHDGGTAGKPWGTINWSGIEPAGTSISVRVQSSEDGSRWSDWEGAQNGQVLRYTPDGRYLKVEAIMQISTDQGAGPVLYDVTILPADRPLSERDTQGPIGAIWINNGFPATFTTTVTLNIAVSDDSGKVNMMRFSNDGTVWSNWEAYGTTRSWALPEGYGEKEVRAQFRDVPGNVSGIISDTIAFAPYFIFSTVKESGANTVIAGSWVVAKDINDNEIARVLADASGNAVIPIAVPGQYTVAAEKTGYRMTDPTSQPVTATVDDGQTTASVTIFMLQRETVYLNLAPGWNFISFNRQPPSGGDIGTVLAGILPNVVVIWGHDNVSKEWLKYIPGADSQTLTVIETKKGYWIYMANADAIDVTDWVPETDTRITLYDVWNLIGYLGEDNADAGLKLNNLAGRWSIFWTWANDEWSAKHPFLQTLPVPLISVLRQGKAYWIKIKAGQAGEWVQ
jgi:hypothetical protein